MARGNWGHKHYSGTGFKKGNKYYESGKATQFKKEETMAEKNVNWKGDNVGYHGLHKWVARKLGKPSYCAYCQSTDIKAYYWANISHAYKRELSDWVRLCAKCHSAYDHGKITL